MANHIQDVVIITTGGTIEKTYDEFDGSLQNRGTSIRNRILSKMRLPYTNILVYPLLSKDSLYMTDEDRSLIAATIQDQMARHCPIVVLHGTDTMSVTAEHCYKTLPAPTVPVVFTGAMIPMGFEDSDASQNVTEALLAAKLLKPGFYISFHNQIFSLPNVRKNKEKGTFEQF
ncbi:MAG TPA: asparaginase domain-containing protein [Bdellovibrio sp.]|uniref:asparaginase domain-containing protein n=1 Tax=Bdellovibrio sp. TaxID=28201 RepID=UPI002F01EEC5